jgi:hypothetical protein
MRNDKMAVSDMFAGTGQPVPVPDRCRAYLNADNVHYVK